ncbi:ankyrin repeat protein [Rhodotorula toruloides]|uniref:Ankyrin repeat protein n=1 Tax=Rhodotorula toruloides TaxID=5286 RepID=A0A511K816_RHOTO|nr:ankyrin repeat protein [Rhodotorula toruloides]
MSSDDPLADPLANLDVNGKPQKSVLYARISDAWADRAVLVEPFSHGWDAQGPLAGSEAEEGADQGEDTQNETHASSSKQDGKEVPSSTDCDSFACHTPAPDVTRLSVLNPAAASFTPSTLNHPSPAPISMHAESATPSPSHIRTTSASSSLEAASSVTPRGVPSPLSGRTEVQAEEASSESPVVRNEREHPVRTASTASSSKGYEPTVLRNLISTACQNGDIERLVSLMSGAGGDGANESNRFTLANQTNPHTGLAPLHYGAQRGHVDVIKWLIEDCGAIPELEDGDGETPLHKAAHSGYLDVCRFLVSREVNVDATDSDGWTALHNASSRGWLDIVRLLLEVGADIDHPSRHGYTPLMNAASKGQLPLVQYLLKQGADPLRRNTYGETAFDLAASVFEIQICSVLAAAEAARLAADPSFERPYNPLELHSTVPIVLHENQRLALPSLKNLSTLAPGGLKWTAKALSRNDGRAAYTSPPQVGASEGPELPCFRSEVGLPIVGEESELVMPPLREVRSGGRVKVDRRSESSTPKPAESLPKTLRRASSSAASSLNAILASSSDPANPPTPSASVASREQAAWIWLSNWVVDTTASSGSPIDGWSYATSFSAPDSEWSPELPGEVRRAFEGGASLATLGGGKKKWVRRRKWVRVMRRRLDLPDWGFADEPNFPRRGEEPSPSAESDDYRSRALFLAGVQAECGAVEIDHSDDEFVYSGRDADGDDDARSVWTTTRPASVASVQASTPQDEHFDPTIPHSSASSSVASPRPVLTPHLAPDFRVPTNETSANLHSHASPAFQQRPLRPAWEPDEAANECRRCGKSFSFFNRKHHCRRCGLVVCAACSRHDDELNPYTVAIEPGALGETALPWLSGTLRRFRTCDECHAALTLPSGVGTTSFLSPQSFFPASPSLGSVTPSEAAASDASDLVECPVCGTSLSGIGDKAQQETHVRECLERGGGSIASGRYLVFTLPPGPLVGEECGVCWAEFEVGDKMARMICLCTFHENCLSGWLARGHSCPIHAARE